MMTGAIGKCAALSVLLLALLVAPGCSAARTRPEEVGGEAAQAAATPPAQEPGEAAEAPPEQPAGPKEESGALTEAEYNELASVGKAVMEAHKLYQQYFEKKQRGIIDTAILDRAIAMYDNLLPRMKVLLEKYPESPVIQEYMKTVAEDRKVMNFER